MGISKIQYDWTKKELDIYLKKKYGYGLWEFSYSLLRTYQIYTIMAKIKDAKKIKDIISNIEKTIQKRLLVYLDERFEMLDYWRKLKKTYREKNERLTALEREKIIIQQYNLDTLSKSIEQDKINVEAIMILKPKKNIRLSPSNLVISIWAEAIKGYDKWKEIQNLILWFCENHKYYDHIQYVLIEDEDALPVQYKSLKRMYYQNKDKYSELVKILFKECFIENKEMKKALPDPREFYGIIEEAKAELEKRLQNTKQTYYLPS